MEMQAGIVWRKLQSLFKAREALYLRPGDRLAELDLGQDLILDRSRVDLAGLVRGRVRELGEELRMRAISTGGLLLRVADEGSPHEILFVEVEAGGEPVPAEHTAVGWFTPEELLEIEKTMRAIVQEDLKVRREEMTRSRAIDLFRQMGEHYKAEIISSIPPGEDVSLYREGGFEDLCRGPHVPSTGKLRHFKLMKVAGAYWRGDAKNEQLQRVYGTAWATRQELDAYLTMLEEAEKRDHRKLGAMLDLFHFQEEAPGAVFWHPHGWRLFQDLIGYMRARQEAEVAP